MGVRSGRSWRAIKRATACGFIAASGLMAAAGPAFADSVTLSVTTTTGESDPVAGIGRTFTLSGSSAAPTNVYVKYRAAGGAPCSSSAFTDSGASPFGAFYNVPVNGAFSIPIAATWTDPGTFVFCYWLAPTQSSVATPFTQAITFRSPTGTITATINPIAPQINQPATITVTGASEAPAYVFARIRPTGGACAPTYSVDTGTGIISNSPVNGAFSIPQTYTPTTTGNYVLCLWLAASSSDPTPVAGPQPQPFTVVGPPPPPPPAPVISRYPTSGTLHRSGSRYSGRVFSGNPSCRQKRTVVLHRARSGSKSFGRAVTRSDGTFTIRRAHRLRGTVYISVLTRQASAISICNSARSPAIRG